MRQNVTCNKLLECTHPLSSGIIPFWVLFLLGRPRRRWEDNIKLDLREIGANWIPLAQDRVQWWAFVNTVMNLRVA
jgi:hypothetical protein